MNPINPSTGAQERLLAGPKGYFFEACLADFDLLVRAGFRWCIEDAGRNCYLVSFKKESASDTFTVRIYHEDDDLLWCDLVCVTNEEIRVRFAEQVDILGVMAPDERLDGGPVPEAVRGRVHELAAIICPRWSEFRDQLLLSLSEKKTPNRLGEQ